MGEAKRRAAEFSRWQADLSLDERTALDVAYATYQEIIARFGATGMCYRITFFLTEILERELGIQARPVVGYVNDGGDAFMSSHAWVELNGKKIDLSLTILNQPTLPSGELLILDRTFKPGQASYTYHRERDQAALELLASYSRNPAIAESIRHKELEHQRMSELAERPAQRRAYLDAAPDGLSYGAMSTLVGGRGFDLAGVLAAYRDEAEAQRYREYVCAEADIDALGTIGRRVLEVFPMMPGACAVMAAMFAVGLEATACGPAYVVAGDLSVPECRVFGDGGEDDLSSTFDASDPSWNGHCWIVVGDRIADVSICRTAKSSKAPLALARHMRQAYESKTGLLIQSPKAAAETGLFYRPRYVLTNAQVDALARAAHLIVGIFPP